jgi:zinc transport system substrate-binding protein
MRYSRLVRLILSTVLLLLSVFILTTAAGCNPEVNPSRETVIAVTILPQASIVETIGGDKVEVVVMVPPGASPHTYEVTPDQMTQLSRAKMYAKVGSPVEFELAWMDKLAAVNRSMLVVDCSQGIQFIEMIEEGNGEEHEGVDPHIWLSVKNVKIMAQNIRDGLIQIDPDNQAYYEANFTAYMDELTSLDKTLAVDFSSISNRSFIIYHPSLGYFAHDYNLNQIGVEQEGKEPDAEYLVRLIEEAKKNNIRVVFVSPQYSTKSAESIAREINGRVLIIDTLAKDIIGNMRAIESVFKQVMQ